MCAISALHQEPRAFSCPMLFVAFISFALSAKEKPRIRHEKTQSSRNSSTISNYKKVTLYKSVCAISALYQDGIFFVNAPCFLMPYAFCGFYFLCLNGKRKATHKAWESTQLSKILSQNSTPISNYKKLPYLNSSFTMFAHPSPWACCEQKTQHASGARLLLFSPVADPHGVASFPLSVLRTKNATRFRGKAASVLSSCSS